MPDGIGWAKSCTPEKSLGPHGLRRMPEPVNRPVKYPRTPYWTWSPTVAPDGRRVADPEVFVGTEVVVTEKLDGSNTLLHDGQAYGRSVSAPSTAPWTAMVKKHHAWKLAGQDILLYGEDIYGVHSIEYGPVAEDRTLYVFALRRGDRFESFDEVQLLADRLRIPVVPVVWRGRFGSVDALRELVVEAHTRPSRLGGQREGVVIRQAEGFPSADFGNLVCKSVRRDHIQTDEHWTGRWKPCALAGGTQ